MPPSRENHARKSFRLITLGGAALVAPDGSPVAEQRRRVAVLVLVAAGGERGISRDKLIAALSPDSPTSSARHALHQLLYYLRRQVGEDTFLGTDPLRLNPKLVTFDVAEFEETLARGELVEAAALYRGHFLDGFHLAESVEFEEWASLERVRLAAKYSDMLVRLAREASGRGEHGASTEWWRKLAAVDPLNAKSAMGLMRALAASGDRNGALQHGQKYRAFVRQELDSDPDEGVESLIVELRAQKGIVSSSSPIGVTPVSTTISTPVSAPATAPIIPPAPMPAAAPDVTPDMRMAERARVVLPRRRARAWIATGFVALVAAVAVMAMRREAPARDAPSLGVVPIVNTAGDSLDYLAEGIARSAMDRLSGSRALRVIMARDVSPSGAPATDIAALGRRVGVSAILAATLARERDTLWLRFELQRSRDGVRLAGGRIAVETLRLVAIESDLLDTVAVALGLTRLRRDARSSRDAQATALLMRAEHHFGKRDTTSFRRAFELYLEAIEHDPASADAYAGLSGTYGAFAHYGMMPAPVAFDRARAAASRALELDPLVSQAIANLSHEQGVRFWQWEEAERGLRDAVRIEPWRAVSWMLLGTQMRIVGRFDEALAAYRNARALDPLARHYTYQIAHAFQCAGEADSAIAALRDAMTLGPSYPAARRTAAYVLAMAGRYDEALEETRVTGRETGDSALVQELAGLRGKAGYDRYIMQMARRELSARERLPAGVHVPPLDFAALHAMLGDSLRSLDWLERARDLRDPSLPMIGCHTEYDFMREHPRFKALLHTMNLTPATFGRRAVLAGAFAGM